MEPLCAVLSLTPFIGYIRSNVFSLRKTEGSAPSHHSGRKSLKSSLLPILVTVLKLSKASQLSAHFMLFVVLVFFPLPCYQDLLCELVSTSLVN